MLNKVEELLEEIEAVSAKTAEEAEALRIKYLGQKGLIKGLFAEFRNVPNESKKEFGAKLNQLKTKAEERIKALQASIGAASNKVDDQKPDLTLPGYNAPLGSRHPISLVRQEIIEIFERIGLFPKGQKLKTIGTTLQR
jgi:phenylalanyl-tRNA synthetase alpha chain